MKIKILLLCIIISFNFLTIVSAEEPLTAAFLRDQQLWIKKGVEEIQLTKGQNVYSPKWSYDERFIAYIDRGAKGDQSNLLVYDVKKQENYQPYEVLETANFKWSPINNQLAFTSGTVLNVTKNKNGRPFGFENVSLGVSDFAWFPNGHDFIVSSQAKLLPNGWGPIHLFKIPIDANLNAEKMMSFYTLDTNTTDLFAINAEHFKWSHDGKWVSFLATPTASMSNDSNTLCVLSSTGEQFQAIGKMLWYEDWIKWASSANQLAYISGEGRFFVENKKTTIADIPVAKKQKQYTPQGYVDLDLEWFSQDQMIVARAKENKEWEEGPVPTMFTSLYAINLKSNEQMQITFPKNEELDVKPQVFGSYVTWFRRTKNDNRRDVWLKDGIDGKERMWIENVDSPPVFSPKMVSYTGTI
ncbi:translocation protein TolB [Anaerobacillus arseniciselenatis]|uniref:Translocation protein TolB n=1 Tax=Anaerobacillus arseniciselenatis TaxID=85682 RepID=A0A1S2LRV8_9BACI|nr:translocation protein TolB [Anaerobacillus arseniciselenatis]OIJ15259.1 translocation protein TolB [Anaerobacillus arseniciselenatis]